MAEATVFLHEGLRKQLEQLYENLQLVQASLTVSAAALRSQSSEQDDGSGRALTHGVSHRIAEQIERIAKLVGSLHVLGPGVDSIPTERRH